MNFIGTLQKSRFWRVEVIIRVLGSRMASEKRAPKPFPVLESFLRNPRANNWFMVGIGLQMYIFIPYPKGPKHPMIRYSVLG